MGSVGGFVIVAFKRHMLVRMQTVVSSSGGNSNCSSDYYVVCYMLKMLKRLH